jgi:hypothetical protein
MELLPDERGLTFPGFTEPIAAYRVDSSRVRGAWVVLVFLVVMACFFVGLCFLFGSDPKQINKPLIYGLCGGFAVLWLAIAVWIGRRLSLYRGQRVLLYPEGIVAWRDGTPHAYEWERLRSVDCKRKLITQGPLERWAYVGKDVEYTVRIDGEEPLILNAMLAGIDDLGEHISQRSRDWVSGNQ